MNDAIGFFLFRYYPDGKWKHQRPVSGKSNQFTFTFIWSSLNQIQIILICAVFEAKFGPFVFWI